MNWENDLFTALGYLNIQCNNVLSNNNFSLIHDLCIKINDIEKGIEISMHKT